jgi:hypothetical protein
MLIHIYYRISDKGREKSKLEFADKFSCLKNALAVFKTAKFNLFADNCGSETTKRISDLQINSKINLIETALGNSRSFLYVLRKAINELDENDSVYFIEDDYIHREGSEAILAEGLAIADYITLYDHPDKYKLFDNKGSPLNRKRLQASRVFITQSTHWRETNSTTMTFAAKVKTLKEDYSIWEKACGNTKTPMDFWAFVSLTQKSIRSAIDLMAAKRNRESLAIIQNIVFKKRRRLVISPIPSYSTHTETDCLAPIIRWDLQI